MLAISPALDSEALSGSLSACGSLQEYSIMMGGWGFKSQKLLLV